MDTEWEKYRFKVLLLTCLSINWILKAGSGAFDVQ